MEAARRPGRPSKGKRERLEFWVPPELKQAIVQQAREAGMHLTDYLAELTAKETGVPCSRQIAVQYPAPGARLAG